MAEQVLMTALSPTMEEGTITTWNKPEGETVDSGDVLCEVETDKASMDYEATQEGTLLKIVVGEGQTARVGQAIAIIGEAGEDITALEQEIAAAAASPPPTAAPEPAAAPTAQQTAQPVADPAPVAPPAAAPKPVPPAPQATRADGERIKASPLAVKLAAERNINLALIHGTGTGGRIVKQDIENFRAVPGGPGHAGASTGGRPAPDESIPVTGKRKVIAQRLSESKFSAPHYYLKSSVEMSATLEARKVLNDSLPRKVSLNAFFIKLCAEALKRHPIVNATWQGDAIVQFGSIDVGIAVDRGNGLITPVVRNCGNRGIVAIDDDLVGLIEKAGDGKLRPEEYSGATFTISNLGSFGVDEFTAIINPPGSAILALGKTTPTPIVAQDGSITVGKIMKMTLSCDHRVIDGAAGAKFLFDLKQMMEQPLRMLF